MDLIQAKNTGQMKADMAKFEQVHPSSNGIRNDSPNMKLNPLNNSEFLRRDNRLVGRDQASVHTNKDNSHYEFILNKTHKRSNSDFDKLPLHIQNNNISIVNNININDPQRNSINIYTGSTNTVDDCKSNDSTEYISNLAYETNCSSPVVEIEEEEIHKHNIHH